MGWAVWTWIKTGGADGVWADAVFSKKSMDTDRAGRSTAQREMEFQVNAFFMRTTIKDCGLLSG